MGLTHSPRIVTDGLVLCLDAANSRSYPGTDTAWTNLAGINNGTFVNASSPGTSPTFDTENAGAIVLDGGDDYIDLGTPSQLNQVQVPITIIFWAKLTVAWSSQRTLWGVYKSLSNNELYSLLRVDGGYIRYFASKATNSWQFQTSTLAPSADVWNFYALRVSGSIASPSVKVFLNESSESLSFSALNSTVASDVNFRIGAAEAGGGSWGGPISTVLWYNVALSDDQILQNYLATKGRYE